MFSSANILNTLKLQGCCARNPTILSNIKTARWNSPNLQYVIVELLKTKCIPSLLYGIEACLINKSVIRSFEYVLNNAFKKIFATNSCDIANECVIMFNCSVYDMVFRRKSKFLNKMQYNENTLCKMFRDRAKFELTELSVSYS